MTVTVFNEKSTAHVTGIYPLFGGEEPSLYDNVNQPYPKFFDLMEKLKQIDWSQDDVDLTDTRMDLIRMSKELRELMLFNLAYQWSLDSIATSIPTLLAPFVTNSEYGHVLARIGENECLSEDAEVLTEKGWKLISDVEKGEEIYAYNPQTKKLSLSPVQETISKPYKGDLLTFKSNGFTQKVTPNHRMLKRSFYTGKETFELAKDINYHGGNRAVVSAPITGNGDVSVLSAIEKLAVAYQADGSWDEKYNGKRRGTIPIILRVKVDRKKKFVQELEEEFKNNGMEVRTYEMKREGFISKTFDVPVEYSDYFCKGFSWFSYNRTTPWYQNFLEEVKKWDAHIGKTGWRYINTNRDAVKVVETAVTLSGNSYSTSWMKQTGKGSLDYAQVYVKSRDYKAGNSIKKGTEYYEGNVYCVTVDSGAFLVRQGGTVSVTGNCLHSVTYSNIVRQCVPDPQEVFDMVFKHEEVLERSTTVSKVLSELKVKGAEYTLGLKTFDECKPYILNGLVAIYSLERISFMSSFACTFALAEQEYCVGGARLVQKILQDEMIHYETQRYALEILSKDSGFKHLFEEDKETHLAIINGVVSQELSWNNYLFKGNRSIVGLNEGILNDWVRYNAQEVCDNLNLTPSFRVTKSCPLPWFESDWMDLNSQQNSNMESDATNYMVNAVSRNVSGKGLGSLGLTFEDEEDVIKEKDEPDNLVLYSKDYCPFCVKLKEFLNEKDYSYTEVDVEKSPEVRDLLKSKGLNTVPQVFDVYGNYYGDCTSFIEKYT